MRNRFENRLLAFAPDHQRIIFPAVAWIVGCMRSTEDCRHPAPLKLSPELSDLSSLGRGSRHHIDVKAMGYIFWLYVVLGHVNERNVMLDCLYKKQDDPNPNVRKHSG